MSQRLANPRLSISEVTYDDMRAAIALWLFGQLFLTFFHTLQRITMFNLKQFLQTSLKLKSIKQVCLADLEAARFYVEEVSRNYEYVVSRCLRLHTGFEHFEFKRMPEYAMQVQNRQFCQSCINLHDTQLVVFQPFLWWD